MAVATLRIALAAVIIVAALNGRRTQELKHETLRQLLERGEKVETDLLRDLLRTPQTIANPRPPPAHHYFVCNPVILFERTIARRAGPLAPATGAVT